MQNMDFRVQ